MLNRIYYKNGDIQTIEIEYLRDVKIQVQGSNLVPIKISMISLDQVTDYLINGIRVFYHNSEIWKIENVF